MKKRNVILFVIVIAFGSCTYNDIFPEDYGCVNLLYNRRYSQSVSSENVVMIRSLFRHNTIPADNLSFTAVNIAPDTIHVFAIQITNALTIFQSFIHFRFTNDSLYHPDAASRYPAITLGVDTSRVFTPSVVRGLMVVQNDAEFAQDGIYYDNANCVNIQFGYADLNNGKAPFKLIKAWAIYDVTTGNLLYIFPDGAREPIYRLVLKASPW